MSPNDEERGMSQKYLDGLPLPRSQADGLDAPFWQGTLAHELRVQQCEACETYQTPAEWVCHRCHGTRLAWPAVEPSGIIYSWMRVHHPVHPALADRGPYLVIVVELPGAGGVKMVGNLLGDPDQVVRIGAQVEAVFEDHDEAALVHWQLGDH